MRPQDFAPRQPYAVIAAGYDVDAQAIIDDVLAAGGTLTNSDKSAINDFVLGAKAASLWARLIDGTLMVGGTAAAVAVDFVRHGQNTIASYTGVPIVSANGLQGDGATVWGTLYQNTDMYNWNNIGVDVFNASDNLGDYVDYGASSQLFTKSVFIADRKNPNTAAINTGSILAGNVAVVPGGLNNVSGLHSLNTDGVTLVYYYRGAAVASIALNNNETPNVPPTILGRNVQNAGVDFRSANLLQFICHRQYFTPLEIATWYNLIYLLQVNLGRNTY